MEKNLKIFTDDIEDSAKEQINLLLDQPAFANSKVRIMPDVHAGTGCVIGFTADLGEKVIPNIVGVDIGCGMHVVKLGNVNINFSELDNYIKDNIPSGFKNNENSANCAEIIDKLVCLPFLHNIDNFPKGVGTLGGGNHFIEVDVDSKGCYYLVIHTGSRNLGNQVAVYYQKLAIKLHADKKKNNDVGKIIAEYKAAGKQKDISKALTEYYNTIGNEKDIPDELCYLTGTDRDNYLHDMKLCQKYAIANRNMIATKICMFLGISTHSDFETIHNYIDDNNIVRKGAISAKKGELVIIPMNMRDGSLLAIGKGNPDWNESAPHGAGRILSRKAARENLSLSDFKKEMSGIYSTTVLAETIDEAPMAYKPMSEIIKNIKDTVKVIEVIKPVYNFKAAEDIKSYSRKKEDIDDNE